VEDGAVLAEDMGRAMLEVIRRTRAESRGATLIVPTDEGEWLPEGHPLSFRGLMAGTFTAGSRRP
jgi:hypothetical protein